MLFTPPLYIEPRDYTAVYTTVAFLSGTARDGPGSHMCLDIKISDDSMVEMDEVFLLTAHSLAPNVNIINTATVIIVNSDGRWNIDVWSLHKCGVGLFPSNTDSATIIMVHNNSYILTVRL